MRSVDKIIILGEFPLIDSNGAARLENIEGIENRTRLILETIKRDLRYVKTECSDGKAYALVSYDSKN